MKNISIEELKKTARLAMLYLDAGELSILKTELSDILTFVDLINEVSGQELAEATGLLPENLREDLELPSLPAEDVLKNAPQSEKCFFAVEARRHE